MNIPQEREITALRALLFTGMDRYGPKSGLMDSVPAALEQEENTQFDKSLLCVNGGLTPTAFL